MSRKTSVIAEVIEIADLDELKTCAEGAVLLDRDENWWQLVASYREDVYVTSFGSEVDTQAEHLRFPVRIIQIPERVTHE